MKINRIAYLALKLFAYFTHFDKSPLYNKSLLTESSEAIALFKETSAP